MRSSRVLMMAALSVIVAGAFSLGFLRGPVISGPTEAETAALAQDAHVVIGDVPLVLPFVAIRRQSGMGAAFTLDREGAAEAWREERDAFRAAAKNAATAPVLDRLDVRIDVWGWSGERLNDPWLALCPQLSRDWARSVCDDPWAALGQALPYTLSMTLTLADDRHRELFDRHTTPGRETIGDHLQAMVLAPGVPDVVCDLERGTEGARRCTAAMLVGEHLLAVWWVGDGSDERAEEMAAREGRVILALLQYGFSPEEDFAALITVACANRRPGSRPPPRVAVHPCNIP